MIKILIIGANGFLGKNIIQFRNDEEIHHLDFGFIAADIEKTDISGDIPFYYIDITNAEDVSKKINKISPDLIVLTAAMTNVDQCEINKNLATKINTEGPKNVLNACKKATSRLIFMSTDFVFDGTKAEGFYSENDNPNPLSHYASTKYESELIIMNSDIDFIICRTAILYGWNNVKRNFITWILNNLQKNNEISIVTTQINNPTFVKNLAQIILKLIEKNGSGIYHTAGSVALSRYEMAIKCAEVFEYNKNLIVPIKNLDQKAIRPKNAGLDISKIKQFLGSNMKIYSLDDGLNYMKNHRNN